MTRKAKKHTFFTQIKGCFAFFKIDSSFLLTFIVAYLIGEVRLYLYFVIFIFLHELNHFFVAKHYGYFAKKIHLNFFGASLEGLDDFTLKDEIKIVLAGPLTNLFAIILCYLSFWFYPESYNYLYEVLIANWAIFCFNFLPIYPLDFGRIILALFTKKYKRKDALKKTKQISTIFLVVLFLVFLVSFLFEYNFTLGFVCVNLAILSFKETQGTSYSRSLFVARKKKLLNRGLLERNIYIRQGTPSYLLFKYIDDYHFINFIFVDENFDVVDTLTEVEFYNKVKI